MRRLLLAVGLFLISPLVAEFLLGDLPITALAGLFVMAPLYGGGALLIREVCRHAGWGWPSMTTLALAYGAIEEGLVTQSLFNPDYAGKHLLVPGHIALLGIGASWTVFVLTLHMVWSIGVPIAAVELLASPERRTAPWLGRLGVIVTAALFLFGAAVTTIMTFRQSRFIASAWQLGVVVGVVVALIAIAAFLGRRHRLSRDREGTVPPAWLLGVASMAVTSLVTMVWYLGRDAVPGWLFVALVVTAHVVTMILISRWTKLPGWTPLHQSMLVAGALITYSWEGFVTSHMLMPALPAVQLVSHIVFASAALLLILAIVLRNVSVLDDRNRSVQRGPLDPARPR